MKQFIEEYARQRFEKWWNAEQGTRMTHSRYLARKAWMAAWFTRLTVKSSNNAVRGAASGHGEPTSGEAIP